MECVCNGAIAQDEGGMDYCRIAVENSNLKIENKRLREGCKATLAIIGIKDIAKAKDLCAKALAERGGE